MLQLRNVTGKCLGMTAGTEYVSAAAKNGNELADVTLSGSLFPVAARGCLPPGANVGVAAPTNQISSAIRVSVVSGFRTWGVNQPWGPLLFPSLSFLPLPFSLSSHFPPSPSPALEIGRRSAKY